MKLHILAKISLPLLALAISGQAAAGCDEKNIGVYDWNPYSGSWDLLSDSWDPIGESQVKLSGDITIPASAFDDGSSGGPVYDPQGMPSPPAAGEQHSRGRKPGAGEIVVMSEPCRLRTVLVTATVPSGGNGAMVVFRPVGHSGGTGIGRGARKIPTFYPEIHCGFEPEVRNTNARNAIGRDRPYAPRGSVWVIEYSNGQTESFIVVEPRSTPSVAPLSGCGK